MIAWASFTAQNIERGYLQFYATGEPSIIFGKPVANTGFASAVSDTAVCNQPVITTSYSASDVVMDVTVVLCDSGPCDNPCVGTLAPQAMGYQAFTTSDNFLRLKIDMAAVATALAINMGMNALNHLVMVVDDNDRQTLVGEMISAGFLNASTAAHISSYYGE